MKNNFLYPRDLNTKTDDELITILTKLNDTANKKVARLREAGLQEYSTAYRTFLLDNNKRKFTTPKKISRNQLLTNIYNVQSFIRTSSSSVEGVKNGIEKFKELTGKKRVKGAYKKYVKYFSKIEDYINTNGVILESDLVYDIVEIFFGNPKKQDIEYKINEMIEKNDISIFFDENKFTLLK